MGRKGVSKRKPKREKSSSNSSADGSASTRSGGHATVASLLRDTGAPVINKGGANPAAGSNKNRNRGN
jgi:hypothetical protein